MGSYISWAELGRAGLGCVVGLALGQASGLAVDLAVGLAGLSTGGSGGQESPAIPKRLIAVFLL